MCPQYNYTSNIRSNHNLVATSTTQYGNYKTVLPFDPPTQNTISLNRYMSDRRCNCLISDNRTQSFDHNIKYSYNHSTSDLL